MFKGLFDKLPHSTASTYSTLLCRSSKEERRKRKERKKLCHITCQTRATSCLFQIIITGYSLIPLISRKGSFRLENLESTFVTYFCILLKVNDVLCNRRMKSQKTTGAMTLVFLRILLCLLNHKKLYGGECTYSISTHVNVQNTWSLIPLNLSSKSRISVKF